MPHDYFWQWHTWWIFPMFMPIFWIVMIGLCLYFIFGRAKPFRTEEPGPGPESALDILKKRYVKGEISKDEFQQMKRDIQG